MIYSKERLFLIICISCMFCLSSCFGPLSYYTEDIESEIFEGLRKRIVAATKPLKVDLYGKTLNTGIRISEKAKKYAQNYYFFDLYCVKIL